MTLLAQSSRTTPERAKFELYPLARKKTALPGVLDLHGSWRLGITVGG